MMTWRDRPLVVATTAEPLIRDKRYSSRPFDRAAPGVGREGRSKSRAGSRRGIYRSERTLRNASRFHRPDPLAPIADTRSAVSRVYVRDCREAGIATATARADRRMRTRGRRWWQCCDRVKLGTVLRVRLVKMSCSYLSTKDASSGVSNNRRPGESQG